MGLILILLLIRVQAQNQIFARFNAPPGVIQIDLAAIFLDIGSDCNFIVKVEQENHP